MNLNGKVITIFGGSGFLGTYIVRELAQAGYTIRIICRNPDDSKALKTAGFVGQIVVIKGNITDYDRLPELIKGSFAIVNMVGILYESGKQKFAKLHAEAPERLASAAKTAGIEKFVQISALVDVDSKSQYAKTKLDGEKRIAAVFPDAYIVRPAVVFGPEDNFFNMFAQMSGFSPFLPLIAGGKTIMQPVYAGDVGLAVAKMINEEVKPGVYELGGPEALSFREILERVLKYTDRKRCFINLPFGIAKLQSMFLPSAILTGDQVELLKTSSVVTSRTKTLTQLDIKPTAIDAIVPKYLARFKKRKPEYVN